MNDSIQRLEEKIAFLEHHVTQQDKAMLDYAAELDRLRREVQRLSDKLNAAGERGSFPEERPPHY